MKLIELLQNISEYQNENTKAVFLKPFLMPNKPQKVSHKEKLNAIKNTKVILSDKPNLWDIPGLFVGSTSFLNKAIKECQIKDIDAEFEGLCMYLGW